MALTVWTYQENDEHFERIFAVIKHDLESRVRFGMRVAPEERPYCSAPTVLLLVMMGHAASVPVRRHQSVQHFYSELLGKFSIQGSLASKAGQRSAEKVKMSLFFQQDVKF